ncbi:MAG TPA: hypothetical protein VGP65_06850, partial [Candidatus Angelobacter sp.]|nr:hypothetical protein [Candidatus Angelobacter sp.]
MKSLHYGAFVMGALAVLNVAILQRNVEAAPSAAGGVRGMIKLDGLAPHQPAIDMSKEPNCAAMHQDKPIRGESVVVGPNGGLANVVV